MNTVHDWDKKGAHARADDRTPRHGADADPCQQESRQQSQEAAGHGRGNCSPAEGGEHWPIADPLDDVEEHRRKKNAKEVIRIGRLRSRDASKAASKLGLPSLCSCWANSTTRMALLHASPTSTT